jgi:hypothetical protein
MLNILLFGLQTVVELTSNFLTLLIGGPILDVLFDPFDVLISAFQLWGPG